MRFYEMALMARPDLSEDAVKELLEKVDKLLKKKRKKAEKGEILNNDDWGVRKLAYPVQKQQKGRYFILTMKCLSDTLAELERNLKLMDEVMRFQTVKLDEEPTFEEKAPKEEAKTEAPAEEPKAEAEKEAEEAAPKEESGGES